MRTALFIGILVVLAVFGLWQLQNFLVPQAGLAPVTFPYTLGQDRALKWELTKRDGEIHVQVYCRTQVPVTNVRVSAERGPTRLAFGLEPDKEYDCLSFQEPMLTGLLAHESDLRSGEQINLGLSVQVLGNGGMTMYAWGSYLVVGSDGKLYED
ncbi:MAG: hypothetical protein HY741_04345 [Chloroflexi bacterium]|nr:hypothetical protein [Chloroflexota bacterium]